MKVSRLNVPVTLLVEMFDKNINPAQHSLNDKDVLTTFNFGQPFVTSRGKIEKLHDNEYQGMKEQHLPFSGNGFLESHRLRFVCAS